MSAISVRKPPPWLEAGLAFLFCAIGGLALSRLLYEGLFPRALWLARPLPSLLLAMGVGLSGWLLWRPLCARKTRPHLVWAFAPLLLNLLYLFDPAVDVLGSRFIFGASLWLTAVFLARALAPQRWWPWLGLLFTGLALFPAYLPATPRFVGQADTFEFQVVVPTLGIAHPTGYPLYILLARLFAALPLGSMAWRVNLASVLCAVLALSLLYLAGRRLLGRELPPLLAAVVAGLTPVIWSQAVVAEVYALQALLVTAVLWLVIFILDRAPPHASACAAPLVSHPASLRWQHLLWLLAFLLGLSLTNHLTSVFLIPPALLAAGLAFGRCWRAQGWRATLRWMLTAGLAFVLPLLLYAYLPLRWQALHDEPMGLARFVDWVIGGRFQGALQLHGWLSDPARFQIVGRLLLANWGWFNLAVAALGLLYLARRNWRAAAVLVVTWIGFVFYALNYYVPDLAVFIIPAHLVLALFWGAGLAAVLDGLAALGQRWTGSFWQAAAQAFTLLILLVPALLALPAARPQADRPALAALQNWGAVVLNLPLPQGAAVLADSEKIAPLYYLQQAEGIRPDLDIMVLPDEAAYRAELDARLAAGQPVYLARFLPGLERVYHLRSLGPLLEVSREPLTAVPPDSDPAGLDFAELRLLAYEVEEPAAIDRSATAVTFFWQAQQPPETADLVYARWVDPETGGVVASTPGQHPAGGYYPPVAWREDEIVPDFHLLPRPYGSTGRKLDLQVALGPPFSPAEDLAWQTVTTVYVEPATARPLDHAVRAKNGRVLLSGADFPADIRPQTPLPLLLSGYGPQEEVLRFTLAPAGEAPGSLPGTMLPPQGNPPPPLLLATEVSTDLPAGQYHLFSEDPSAAAICGWMAQPTAVCDLGPVALSGAPLPAGATNFDDKIALLSIDLPDRALQPGGKLPVTLQWQGLADMAEDYTVFLQVLDAQDRLVGQVDAWPLQGTFPTSAWTPGEMVRDPYEIQLAADLPPGEYRLQAGWYLLGTLRRLPVVDENGRALDDKVVVGGLTVAE